MLLQTNQLTILARNLAAAFVQCLILFALSGTVFPAHAEGLTQQVEKLRLWHSPDRTRVVFDVSANVTHKMFSLQDPLRLVVDIENANFSMQLPSLDSTNKHISGIRSGSPDAGVLRFVFELKQPLKAHDFVLSPNELYGHRLVIDLKEEGAPSSSKVDTAAGLAVVADSSPARQNQTAGKNAPASVISNDSQAWGINHARQIKPILIAIDAGHGGEDPGALGYRGSREKKITLEIANRLKKIIDAEPRMKSYMVRRGDYYIKLHKRRLMARAVGADMFISIHADAFRRRAARGFSVFALSQRGATSAMAQALAEKENASDLIGGVSLADKDDVLAKVLVDLSMTNTIGESVNLGGRVIKELNKIGRLHSKRVEQAGFAVLKSADIPSILVETGFITNPDEERKLKSGSYQQKLARALFTAINEYFQQTPYRSNASYATPFFPREPTKPAVTKPIQPDSHRVVVGDSLSEIALRYGTSVKELKKLNNLRSDTAVLGKRLKLPNTVESTVSSVTTKKVVTRPIVHTVRAGDSLSKISLRYNVTIKALKTANELRKDQVYIGQAVKIPGVSGAASVTPKRRTHKVKRGDTLSEIAERYASSTHKIMQANSLSSQTVILGQILKIPN